MQAAFASPARAPLRPVASVLQEVARKATCEKSSGSMKARNNALGHVGSGAGAANGYSGKPKNGQNWTYYAARIGRKRGIIMNFADGEAAAAAAAASSSSSSGGGGKGDGYIKPKTLWCPRRGAAPRSAPKADQVRAMQGVAVMATAAAAAAAVAAAAVTRPSAVALKPASTQAPAPSVA